MLSTENAKQILVKTNGESLRKARELGPEKTIELITRKGLKGRGGAGNLAGKKWADVRAQALAEPHGVRLATVPNLENDARFSSAEYAEDFRAQIAANVSLEKLGANFKGQVRVFTRSGRRWKA